MKKALIAVLITVILAVSVVLDVMIIKALLQDEEPEAPTAAVNAPPTPADQPKTPDADGPQSGSGPSGTAESSGEAEPSGGEKPSGTAQPAGEEKEPEPLSGLFITVKHDTGEMEIQRPLQNAEKPMGEAGTWTVFVYLCGADLESERGYDIGAASADLREMRRGALGDRVRYVVQTGGASYWYDSRVDPERTQRFVVENGTMTLVYDAPASGMGRAETLADFLTWGVQNYGAANMGVILWNHGGGSITGVCFDELEEYDSLSLRELDAAFLSAGRVMTDRFAFVGIDACLMATLETANVLASYADYMVASQESESGEGWDYRSLGRYLTENPEADGEEIGRVICDTYFSVCESTGAAGDATLSLIDLRRMDALLQCFNRFSEGICTATGDSAAAAGMVRGIVSADNFGGNNKVDGYTNMVDLGGLISACASWAEGGEEALEALSDAVIYQVRGSDHADASGLSVYYPLSLEGSEELAIFGDVCVSPYYLSFVDKLSRGSVDGLYAEDDWFPYDAWSWIGSYGTDDDTGYYAYEQPEDTYWSYADEEDEYGESTLITFEEEPHLDEDGYYSFVLSPESREYAVAVEGLLYRLSEDEEYFIELGETWDVDADWENGRFSDNFDGCWLCLPDGQVLATYIADETADYVVYASPVYLNGELTNLRIRQYADGEVTVEGAWSGIDENGAASRETVLLQDGDVIEPFYYCYGAWDDEESYRRGEAFRVTGELTVGCEALAEGDYYYAFYIDDLFGKSYTTDFTVFYVDESGDVYFYED